MTNKKRRLLVTGIWTTPVITMVSLPAHAQTSICPESNYVGEWQVWAGDQREVLLGNYILNSDNRGTYEEARTTDSGSLEWSESNNLLTISLSNESTMRISIFFEFNCGQGPGIITDINGNEERIYGYRLGSGPID